MTNLRDNYVLVKVTDANVEDGDTTTDSVAEHIAQMIDCIDYAVPVCFDSFGRLVVYNGRKVWAS
jgi:hypothetical protein